MKEKYTTADALKELDMSESTFFNRVRELKLLPINFKPGLKRPRRSYWSPEQIKAIGELAQVQREAFLTAC